MKIRTHVKIKKSKNATGDGSGEELGLFGRLWVEIVLGNSDSLELIARVKCLRFFTLSVVAWLWDCVLVLQNGQVITWFLKLSRFCLRLAAISFCWCKSVWNFSKLFLSNRFSDSSLSEATFFNSDALYALDALYFAFHSIFDFCKFWISSWYVSISVAGDTVENGIVEASLWGGENVVSELKLWDSSSVDVGRLFSQKTLPGDIWF